MEREVSRASEQARKADTRSKIMLGGLVRKAGLGDESEDVLLGILLEAAERLGTDGGALERARWSDRGRQALKEAA